MKEGEKVRVTKRGDKDCDSLGNEEGRGKRFPRKSLGGKPRKTKGTESGGPTGGNHHEIGVGRKGGLQKGSTFITRGAANGGP